MEKPRPVIGPDNAFFWEGCKRRQLVFQKCKSCGHVRWPPAHVCPKCLEYDWEEIVSSGQGIIYSYVIYHFPYHPGFREELPYVVALVDLMEGPRVLTNIIECDSSALACDLPVEIVWDEEGEIPIPKFRLRKA
ncbi:MAG: OB-fold domain-containing protein [Syntrophales bacterium]|nr:OB-fold domain-containing protein [Syntrophales bacterium]